MHNNNNILILAWESIGWCVKSMENFQIPNPEINNKVDAVIMTWTERGGEGRREEGRDEEREGGRGREGGREEERKGGREGGRKRGEGCLCVWSNLQWINYQLHIPISQPVVLSDQWQAIIAKHHVFHMSMHATGRGGVSNYFFFSRAPVITNGVCLCSGSRVGQHAASGTAAMCGMPRFCWDRSKVVYYY